MLHRHGKTDSGGVSQYGFLGAFDEHHIDNADYLALFHLKKRTTTVSRICGSVKLVDLKRATFQALDYLCVQLTGCRARYGNLGNGLNDGAMDRRRNNARGVLEQLDHRLGELGWAMRAPREWSSMHS